jgi:hypothetical protein
LTRVRWESELEIEVFVAFDADFDFIASSYSASGSRGGGAGSWAGGEAAMGRALQQAEEALVGFNRFSDIL